MTVQQVKRSTAIVTRFVTKVAGPGSVMRIGLRTACLRRAPQVVRQQLNIATRTVDEEFEKFCTWFDNANTNCLDILDLLSSYEYEAHEIVETSRKVTDLIRILSNTNFPVVSDQDRSIVKASDLVAIQNPSDPMRSYLAMLDDMGLTLNEVFARVPMGLEDKINTLLKYAEKVARQIRKRDAALLRYDGILDKLDGMAILQVSNTFTARQRQLKENLERKLALAQLDYARINDMLKLELPFYFVLVREFMEYVLQFFFYVQLSVTYQFNRHLLSLQGDLKISAQAVSRPEFLKTFVAEFLRDHTRGPPDLKMITGHQEYLDSLAEENDNPNWKSIAVNNLDPFFRYCKAMFNYAAKERGDLDLRVGDLVKVIDATGEWWKGELHGKMGRFPRNYVAEVAE